MKKRIFALCCALMLSLSVFTACQSAPASEASSTPEATATAEPTATPEATPTAEPTQAPSIDPENMNLLTGLPTLSEEAIGKRPVAVMVNNVDAALPQYGISAADVIFEIPVEGDLTRLMALYGDYTQIPDVCSIRSCRYYYPILSSGFDAIYVHWGIDPTIATKTVNNMGLDHFDGDWYGDGAYFGRDQNRLNSGYAWEHTGVFHGKNLSELLESTDTRTDLKEDKLDTAFNFVAMDNTTAPAGETANSVRVDFGANYSTFRYDEKTHTYLKNYKDSAHMDAETNEQLAFENVIVLETEISIRDKKGRKNIDWQGGEDSSGYYISEGKMQKITWSKADEYSPLKFFDEGGAELQINRGKSYIAFTYAGNCTISE